MDDDLMWEDEEEDDTPAGSPDWFVQDSTCPTCWRNTLVKWDSMHCIMSFCENCGRFIINEGCCKGLRADQTGLLHLKAERWLRETNEHDEIRFLSLHPEQIDDPEIAKCMDLQTLAGMYESSGSREEYDQTLIKLAAFAMTNKGRFYLHEVTHLFPSVQYEESLLMLSRMEHGRHVAKVPELGDMFFVADEGIAYLRQQIHHRNEQSSSVVESTSVNVPRKGVDAARHTPDYRSVCWRGRLYTFTPMQALAVKCLWEAHDENTPDLGEKHILEKVLETTQTRLRDVFKRHPAWKKLIVHGRTRGTYRLAI